MVVVNGEKRAWSKQATRLQFTPLAGRLLSSLPFSLSPHAIKMSESNSKVIPTPEAISEASKLEVLDLNGEKLLFGSLFKSERAIVIFIR